MDIVIYSLIFFALTCIGSFIGVCFERIPEGESIIKGRSHCESCGKTLKGYELVPIISYLFLRGRCSKCKKKIPLRCLGIEFFTAVFGIIPLIMYGVSVQGFAYCAISCILFEIALLDFKTMEISDFASLLIGLIGIAMMIYQGTLAVGLLANPDAPAGLEGLFYTGSFKLLGIQTLGITAILAWTAVTMTITFLIIKKTVGLRVSKEEEIKGLDSTEHGLPSAYADFIPAVESLNYGYDEAVAVTGDIPVAEAVPVKKMPTFDDGTPKLTKVEIICKESRFEALKAAMVDIGITGMTVSHVLGCGVQKGKLEYYRGVQVEANLLPKVQVDIVVSAVPVRSVIETAKKVLYTGHIGDGISSAEASSNLARFDGVRYGYRCDDYSNIDELYRKSRSEGFGSEVKKRIMLGTFALSSGYYDAYYKKALQVRSLVRKDFDEAFGKCDFIISPVAPTVAYKIGEKTGDSLQMYMGDAYSVPVNIAGIPALTLPCGIGEGGMPVGMQLIGPAFSEGLLYRAGFAFESTGK